MELLTKARAERMVSRAEVDFGSVRDPREQKNKRSQSLEGILRLFVTGFACGKLVLRDLEALSEDMPPRIRRRLGLRKQVSDTTQWEILSSISTAGFAEVLGSQLRRGIDSKAIINDRFAGGVASYDGKGAGSRLGEAPNEICRRSTCDVDGTVFWDLYALRACLTSSSAQPVLSQTFIPNKRGEATTFPDMLARDVECFPRLFRYVTTDAGMASRGNAEVVMSHQKMYVFQIKGNFGHLYPIGCELLEKQEVQAETTENERGMIVRRELRRVAFPANESFPGATQFVGVKQVRIRKDGTTETENRVFITCVPWTELSTERWLKLVRLHWVIENGSNWTHDVILNEDLRKPCNQGYGPIVISWLLVLSYNLMSMFRSHLPLKDCRPCSWSRVQELLYQAWLGVGRVEERAVVFEG